MKLIGVMGKSGAGKSTFATYLANHPSVGLIHIDDLLSDVKYKYFKIFLKRDENHQIEKLAGSETQPDNPKLRSDVKKFFYKSKTGFNFLMWVRDRLLERPLSDRIEECRRQGKKAVVIDDWVLDRNKKLFNRLDKIYFVEREYLKRRAGLRERDNLNFEEMKVADLPYALELIEKPLDIRVITIDNRGSIEDLKEKAEKEYLKLNIQTFDEKYKVKVDEKKSIVERLLSTLGKTSIDKSEDKTKERVK